MARQCCGKNDFHGIGDDCTSLEMPFATADFAESLFFLGFFFFKLNQPESDSWVAYHVFCLMIILYTRVLVRLVSFASHHRPR